MKHNSLLDLKEIESIFDTISYKKGASIIHMLERLVGEQTIRSGLSRYLKRHEYDTAVTSDLWVAISDAWNGNKKYNFTVQVTYSVQEFPFPHVYKIGILFRN